MKSFWLRFFNRGLLFQIVKLGLLCSLWLMLWGKVSVTLILSGLIVGYWVIKVSGIPRVPIDGVFRPFWVLCLFGMFIWYLILASIQVAWFAIRPKKLPEAGLAEIFVDVQSEFVLVLILNFINIVPGTLVVDLDVPRRWVLVHMLDRESEVAMRSQMILFEKFCRRAFQKDVSFSYLNIHNSHEVGV